MFLSFDPSQYLLGKGITSKLKLCNLSIPDPFSENISFSQNYLREEEKRRKTSFRVERGIENGEAEKEKCAAGLTSG